MGKRKPPRKLPRAPHKKGSVGDTKKGSGALVKAAGGLVVERVRVEDLLLDPANVRLHDERNLAALAASLKRFGQQKPIVVDARGIIVAGNATLDAARQLGWTHLDVVRTGLEGAERMAYGIADNRLAELATWDDQALADLLEALRAEDESLPGDAGFLEEDLAVLLAGNVKEGETDPDAVPEAPKKAVSKRSEVYLLGEHRLMCGDSTKTEDVGRLMGAETAETLFTSPPYWTGKDYDKACGSQGVVRFMDRFANTWTNVINRRIIIESFFTTNQKTIGDGGPMRKVLLCAMWQKAMEDHGWLLRHLRWWLKQGTLPHTTPVSDMVDESCEGLFVFYRPGHNEGGMERVGEEWVCRGYWDDVPGRHDQEHPAVFPVEIPSRMIRLYSRPGAIIAEPFSGSGTTIIAAEQLGRRCFGMEIEPRYVDVARRRWAEFVHGEGCAWQALTPKEGDAKPRRRPGRKKGGR